MGEGRLGNAKARAYTNKDFSLGAEVRDGRGRAFLDSKGTVRAEFPVGPRSSLIYEIRPRGKNPPSGSLQYKQKFR